MRPVVIDTNCLVQMISKRCPYRPIWDAFLDKRFTLCVSNEILEEYQEVIEQQTTPEIAENIILLLFNQGALFVVVCMQILSIFFLVLNFFYQLAQIVVCHIADL